MIARNATILRSLAGTAVAVLVCLAAVSATAQEPSKGPAGKAAKPAAKAARSVTPELALEPLKMQVFPVRYAKVDELLMLVVQFMPGEAQVAADRRSNAIVAQGPAKALEAVSLLVAKFDVPAAKGKSHPAATFTVRIVWLAEGLSDAPGSPPPAQDLLAGVVKELESLGIKNVRQVAQTVLKTAPDGEFRVSASPLLNGTPVEFTASGKVRGVDEYMARKSTAPGKALQFDKDGADIRITISASRQRAERRAAPGSDSKQKLADLEMEAVVGLGDCTVLAVAPTEDTTSIFVIQVTPNLSLIRP